MKTILWILSIIIILIVAWYLISPLFRNEVVNDPDPFSLPEPEEFSDMSENDLQKIRDESLEAAAQMPEKEMSEAMPDAEGSVSTDSSGVFKGADSFHRGSGVASILTLPNGESILRLENFSVTNGPDLHILVSEHPDPSSRSEVKQNYIDLGRLKGNAGNQNYSFPEGEDISRFKSVVIYCDPFHVIFATAPLE